MLIVDGQIHLWEKGTPSPQHRQEPFSAEQAIAAMDEAGVDRALVHPVLWDPDSNELAVEAVQKHPDRFAIMGWFYLDDPNGPEICRKYVMRHIRIEDLLSEQESSGDAANYLAVYAGETEEGRG